MKKVFILLISFFGAQMYLFAQTAPNFTVTDTKGNTHRLYEDYLDQGQTVMIDLFFVACPPCNARAPFIQQLFEDWGNGNEDLMVMDMTISGGDDDNDVLGFENRHGLTFPGISADGGSLQATSFYTSQPQFFATPSFVVIDPRDKTFTWVYNNGDVIQKLDDAIASTGAMKPVQQLFEVSGRVETFNGRFIPNVILYVQGFENQSVVSDANGEFYLELPLSEGQQYNIIAESFELDFRSGVSTIDLAMLIKHVLNVQPLNSNFQRLAADVFRDNNVSTFDIVAMRKLILNNSSTATGHTSAWKFFPQNGSSSFNTNNLSNRNFIGIKIGDLNDSIGF